MSRSDGVLSIEEVKSCPGWPGDELIEKKKVAVLECVEDIPCNPCEEVCPAGAIRIGLPITNLPYIDGNKCNGCSLCVAVCPGLAIFVIEKNYSNQQSTITMPYELLPLPDEGDTIKALNRRGEFLCNAQVIKVLRSKRYDKTNLITVVVDKRYFNQVRGIKV